MDSVILEAGENLLGFGIFVVLFLLVVAVFFAQGFFDFLDFWRNRASRESALLVSASAAFPPSVVAAAFRRVYPLPATANGGRSVGGSCGQPVDGAGCSGSDAAAVAVHGLSMRSVHTVPKASSTVPAAPMVSA